MKMNEIEKNCLERLLADGHETIQRAGDHFELRGKGKHRYDVNAFKWLERGKKYNIKELLNE